MTWIAGRGIIGKFAGKKLAKRIAGSLEQKKARGLRRQEGGVVIHFPATRWGCEGCESGAENLPLRSRPRTAPKDRKDDGVCEISLHLSG